MPITATFGMIFLVAKVDVVGLNPIARSNNKRRLPKGSLFCYSEWRDEEPRKSGADKDERRTEVRRRGGKPSEDAAATHITCVFNFCNLIKII